MAEGTITGRQVLIGMIAFFGVVFAVNGVFMFQALSTHTGVVANEPYRKGLTYNERIEADRQQSERGWSGEIALAPAEDGITITLADRNGRPLTGLALAARLGRPSTSEKDLQLALTEKSPGLYEARIATIERGTWQFDVEAKQLTGHGDEIVWRARKRLWLKP